MNQETVSPEKLIEVMKESFDRGESLPLIVTGHSMRPLLRHLRDKVILVSPKKKPPAIHDIILFRRKNGKIVLHRILRVTKNGDLVLNGDAQMELERVEKNQVLAVVSAVVRKNRYISCDRKLYKSYVKTWTSIRMARRYFIAVDNYLFQITDRYRRKRRK